MRLADLGLVQPRTAYGLTLPSTTVAMAVCVDGANRDQTGAPTFCRQDHRSQSAPGLRWLAEKVCRQACTARGVVYDSPPNSQYTIVHKVELPIEWLSPGFSGVARRGQAPRRPL